MSVRLSDDHLSWKQMDSRAKNTKKATGGKAIDKLRRGSYVNSKTTWKNRFFCRIEKNHQNNSQSAAAFSHGNLFNRQQEVVASSHSHHNHNNSRHSSYDSKDFLIDVVLARPLHHSVIHCPSSSTAHRKSIAPCHQTLHPSNTHSGKIPFT